MERTIAVLTTLTVAGVAARPGTAKAPSEPNDRLDTATAPHADGECSTAIETLNDRDFYASTPTGRDAQLTVRLTNDLSESAYENWARWTLNVDIVDAQNEVLLQADASAHADRAAILEVTVPDPSTWYIRAEGRERVSGIPYRFTHTAGSPDRCRWRRVRRPSGCTPRSDLRSPRPRESDGQVNVRVAARCSGARQTGARTGRSVAGAWAAHRRSRSKQAGRRIMRAERAHRAALRRVTTRFRKGVTVDACSSHVDLANGQFTGSMRGSQIRSHDGSVLSQSHAHVTNAPTTLPQPSTGQEVQDVLFAERAGVPFLWYRDHAGAPVLRVLEAETGQLTVGRHSSSDLALPWDDAVSRSHAVLERLGRTWTLVDDGLSRNGTYVNGTRLRGRVRLHDRDALRFGGTLMRFRAPVSQASVGATRVDDDALVTAESLTPMQRKVLVALCRPFRDNPTYATPATNQTIADELVLSVDAIKTHMRGIFQRFGVQELPHNQKRARVVELAFQSGVIGERDL